MWWKILLAVLAVIVVLLVIPVRYSVKAEMWKATVTVKALGGLVTKALVFPKPKKKKDEEIISETPEEIPDEPETPKPAESPPKEKKAGAPVKKKPPAKDKAPPEKTRTAEKIEEPVKKDQPAEPEISKKEKPKKKKSSIFQQICFAAENGTLEAALKAAAKIIAHSYPGKWRIRGAFGSGDPMTTGTIQGMAQTFLPRVTEEVEWKYIDAAHKLEGEGYGRVIPIYVLGIVLRLAVARPVRQFWRYRQGGN